MCWGDGRAKQNRQVSWLMTFLLMSHSGHLMSQLWSMMAGVERWNSFPRRLHRSQTGERTLWPRVPSWAPILAPLCTHSTATTTKTRKDVLLSSVIFHRNFFLNHLKYEIKKVMSSFNWKNCIMVCVYVCVCVCVCALARALSLFSRIWLFMRLWTIARQAPQSMGFSRQEYWSGLPFPLPGDLPHSGMEPVSPVSPALQADSLPSEPLGKPHNCLCSFQLSKKFVIIWLLIPTFPNISQLFLQTNQKVLTISKFKIY